MEGELWGLAVHPVKQIICTGSDDGTVRLWDTDKHVMLDVVANVGKPVRCVSFSHDGGALAIGMKDGKRRMGGKGRGSFMELKNIE